MFHMTKETLAQGIHKIKCLCLYFMWQIQDEMCTKNQLKMNIYIVHCTQDLDDAKKLFENIKAEE